ncbi:MAG TPA: S41 family peptidase [Anaerolineales bacterium]|nr:S41 family peptidase [Anaerolineales bacterium]
MYYRKFSFLIFLILLTSLWLSGCGSLLEAAEEAVGGDYGPAYVPQDHQSLTFEALWKNLTENYVYSDTSDVNWDALHDKYNSRIEPGLTNEQFSDLLRELQAELPAGALLYQSRSERIEADIADASSYEGIGAIVGFQEEEEPHVVILDVIDGSPAENAGLKPHDSIYEIDGNPILVDEGLTVVNRIRGPAGSTVNLQVKSPGEDQRAVQVTRGKLVSGGKLESHQIPDTNYGYVLFPPLSYQEMMEDFRAILQELTTNQKLEGLILDLRVAGSTRGWPLQDLLTIFHDGTIGEFYNRANETQVITIQGDDYLSSQTVPLIILTGANTSGQPEILAASLQAGKRATIVGEATAGSIEVTEAFYLPDGSRIFVETASFRLADGTDLGSDGLQPDVKLDEGWDEIQPSADPVLEKAIDLLNEQK